MKLSELQKRIQEEAKQKQWGTTPEEINFGEKIALTHQELSEALEAYRDSNMNGRHGVAEELADALMRIAHLAEVYGIDLESEVEKKFTINKDRDWTDDPLYKEKK